MYRYPFAVAETAYCCWDHDLPERNESFLKGLDPGYFTYVAQCHLEHLEGDDCQRAAIGLRSSYHHAVETLFSLLGALAQAPHAVPAWIPKCDNGSLRTIVKALSRGELILTQLGRRRVSLPILSETIHQFAWADDQPTGATTKRYAHLWTLLASEFLDDRNIAEYKSLKHGFRVSAGGFVLRVGEQTEVGVPAPESSMVTVGGSPFGTNFLEPQPITGDESTKFHFRIRRAALNWRAEAMAQRLQLISWSINNVVGALRCLNGSDPTTITFFRPEDPNFFDGVWKWDVGVFASNMDLTVDRDEIVASGRPELLRELEQRTSAQTS